LEEQECRAPVPRQSERQQPEPELLKQPPPSSLNHWATQQPLREPEASETQEPHPASRGPIPPPAGALEYSRMKEHPPSERLNPQPPQEMSSEQVPEQLRERSESPLRQAQGEQSAPKREPLDAQQQDLQISQP
jgi:hypothetical protein